MNLPSPALGSALAADPDRPVLTYYDDATGERTELSALGLGEWVTRTTNLLHHGCGLRPGDRAAVLLPPHWQTAAVLLGTWSAGMSVSFEGFATAGLPRIGDGSAGPFDVTYVARSRVDSWLEEVPDAAHRFVVGTAAPGAPLRDIPEGYRDYLAEVREHDPNLRPYVPVHRAAAAMVDGTSYEEWGNLARELASNLDFHLGDRILIDAAEHEHPVWWLLAPLAAGASVVLCANLDPARLADRREAERVTRVL